ncbi:helix-turn-helix domain-containing protein [Chenggangzhangella methanolivorans]|uniref:Helix-turn-helix domain-containing protein n=1 Tax=Chenggangzhangella methanolivorans TaxID=1437009 RepID=A0A9E6RDQ4_9HYPH|nr:helix-turn-helix domain-containing protein [Chenggangzhangella methanolivorans]
MPPLSETEVILKALTKGNIEIIGIINREAPESVAELARLASRSQSNVSRSLSSLVELKIIRLEGKRPKRPVLNILCIKIRLSEIIGA